MVTGPERRTHRILHAGVVLLAIGLGVGLILVPGPRTPPPVETWMDAHREHGRVGWVGEPEPWGDGQTVHVITRSTRQLAFYLRADDVVRVDRLDPMRRTIWP